MSTIPKDISTTLRSYPNSDSDTYVSFDDYMRLYRHAKDGYKYEWNNGKIEKTTSMKQIEAAILDVLMRLFIQTKIFQNGGIWSPEIEMWTSESQYRIPDLSIYYKSQRKGLVNGENQIAPWVGEVISPTDTAARINKKLIEYFAAGVKVVWHIYPESEQVHVFTSLDDITICRGKKVCSAKPALDDFEISAAEIFAYKKHLKKKA